MTINNITNVLFIICFFLLHHARATDLPAGMQQSNDWVVNPTCNPSRVSLDTITSINNKNQSVVTVGHTLTLSNDLIARTFLIDPAFCTIEYVRRGVTNDALNFTFLRALAPEGNLTLNDTFKYDIGGCAGMPAMHSEFFDIDDQIINLYAPNTSFTFSSYSVSSTVAPFPFTPGQRGSSTTTQWPPAGLHLTVTLSPPRNATYQQRFGIGAGLALNLQLHYEIYDCIPVMRKWVTAELTRSPAALVTEAAHKHGNIPHHPTTITLSTLNIEILRAPNGAPERFSVFEDTPNNPLPTDGQVVPMQNYPIAQGRTQQLWSWDPEDDMPNDQELHVQYTMYTMLVYGYDQFDTVYGGPRGPGWVLSASATDATAFTSISIREVLHDSVDEERHGLTIRRAQAVLAPQLLENPMHMMITDIGSDTAFQTAIDQAAEAGLELLVIGFGANGYCGLCDAQLKNETWVLWFASWIRYAHDNGLEVTAYTLMQHNGWGEDTPAAEQVLQRDGTRGGIACFATDFHSQYRAAVLEFIEKTGLAGLETDGQYEGASCSDSGGDHHHNGVAGSWHAQLFVTLNFNSQLKTLKSNNGVTAYQTGADAYMFAGANRWNHADSDAGYNLNDFSTYVTQGRLYCYDSTTTRLPSSGMYILNNLYDMAERDCGPGSARLSCIDYAFGIFYGSGIWGYLRQAAVVDPNDKDAAQIMAIKQTWTTFWAKFRPWLAQGDYVHIARPTSRGVEATMLTLPPWTTAKLGTSIIGILCLANPRNTTMTARVAVPLYYAGITPGATVNVEPLNASHLGFAMNNDDAAADYVLLGSSFTKLKASGVRTSEMMAPTTHQVGSDGFGLYEIGVPTTMAPISYAIFFIATS